jgi:hypothetical protein
MVSAPRLEFSRRPQTARNMQSTLEFAFLPDMMTVFSFNGLKEKQS